MQCFAPMAFRLSAIMFVLEFMVGTTSSSMVRAQSTDWEAVCAARALSTFQDLGREYRAVLEMLNVPFEIKSSNYQAFYSSKIDRCLLTVRKTTSIMRELSDMAYLIDADTRRMYAVYIETDGKIESLQSHTQRSGDQHLQGPRRIRRLCQGFHGKITRPDLPN